MGDGLREAGVSSVTEADGCFDREGSVYGLCGLVVERRKAGRISLWKRDMVEC